MFSTSPPIRAALGLFAIVAAVIAPPLVGLADRVTATIRNSRKIGLWFDRAFGGLRVALGLWLALSERVGRPVAYAHGAGTATSAKGAARMGVSPETVAVSCHSPASRA